MEVLKELGINKQGTQTSDSYVVTIADSDAFGVIYSKLENADNAELIEEASSIAIDSSNITYEVTDTSNNIYTLNLIADFNGDVYRLVVREK